MPAAAEEDCAPRSPHAKSAASGCSESRLTTKEAADVTKDCRAADVSYWQVVGLVVAVFSVHHGACAALTGAWPTHLPCDPSRLL